MTELETLRAEIAKRDAIIAGMKADRQAKLTCKVTPIREENGKVKGGAVAVYGLGKWPITLYKSQWDAFIPFIKSGAVERFIEANSADLSVKA